MDTGIIKIDALNDLRAIHHAIDNSSKLADSTKKKYKSAIQKYMDAGYRVDAQDLARYGATASGSARSFLKAVITLWTQYIERELKSGATPENVRVVDAVAYRFDSMRRSLEVQQEKGTKSGLWLTQRQVKAVMAKTGDSISGMRDWVILGCLVGAGLRRQELTELTFDSLHLLGDRFALQVHGKGAKNRVIPIKRVLGERLQAWQELTGPGLVARSLGMEQELGESMSGVAVFHLVRKYGAMINKPKLAPHDLRRTYAQLGYEAGVPITQISLLLGHASVKTTQRYLNVDLDLSTTVSDFIPLD